MPNLYATYNMLLTHMLQFQQGRKKVIEKYLCVFRLCFPCLGCTYQSTTQIFANRKLYTMSND